MADKVTVEDILPQGAANDPGANGARNATFSDATNPQPKLNSIRLNGTGPVPGAGPSMGAGLPPPGPTQGAGLPPAQPPGVSVSEAPMSETQARDFGLRGNGAAAPDPRPSTGNWGPKAGPTIEPMAPPAPPAGAAPPVTPPTTPSVTPTGKPYAVGKALGKVGRFAGGFAGPALAADTVSHMNDYKINDPAVDSSAMGTIRAVGNGDWAGAGRSLSKGALEAGMDLGSVAANVADYVVPGKAPVSTAYNAMLRRNFGDQLQDNSGQDTTPAASAPAGANVGAAMAAAGGSGATQPPGPATPAGPTTPDIRKVGNTYTNVTDQTDFNKTKNPINVAKSVGTATNDEVMKASMDNANSGYFAPTPGMATIGQTGFGGKDSDHNANFDKDVAAGKVDQAIRLGGKQGPAQAAAITAQFHANQGNKSLENIAAMKERGDTIRAGALNASNLAIHKAANATTERGQDKVLQGHMAPLQLQQMLRQQAASYLSGVRGNGPGASQAPLTAAEYGIAADRAAAEGREDVATSLRAQATAVQAQETTAQTGRDAATKNFHDEMLTNLPPGADNKPDEATAARYTQAAVQAHEARMRALQTHLNLHPEDTPKAQELASLKSKGLGAVDMARHVSGMQLADLRAKSHSAWNPRAGTDVESSAPVSHISRKPVKDSIFGDHYLTYTNGKPDGGKIPANEIDKPGSTLNLGGKAGHQFDHMKGAPNEAR